jgi:hypothetical protein
LGQEIKQKNSNKNCRFFTPNKLDKKPANAIIICITKGKKMKTNGIFLPFWKLMGAIFVYYLFIEGLKKLGLVQGKTK